MILLTRRLPGILYSYRYVVYSAATIISTFIYFLFKWNLLCVNLQAWRHVERVCSLFDKGLALGSLCAPLCISKDILSLTCHSFQSAKDAVFSAEWHDIKLVFKSVPMDVQPIHWYDNGVLKYPTEKEFLSTIRTIVKRKLNLTLAYDTAVRLTHLKPSYEEQDLKKRHLEMDHLWYLLQDNEYLLSTIFTDKDIFPQPIGTCGPYFAVEYLEPIRITTGVFSVEDSLATWSLKLKLALNILDLLEELDSSFREPFHLCDIKLNHFGYTSNRKKLKFIDLNMAFPRTIIASLFKDLNFCDKDLDCQYLDCKAMCNKTSNMCDNLVTSDNHQIICEKIFLGWRMSNTVQVPGLLISEYTPDELASILRQCANARPDTELKRRLYDIIYEVLQAVNV
ncbi:hypothetical protein ABEB36_014371 [Hypothenemus hampei]|uniref:FAM69 N-terminal domain-containing protein n=1 Tax=Hypothenemus hampei TaxID=57062 RepID=A0ABD1E6Z9_HYPHA